MRVVMIYPDNTVSDELDMSAVPSPLPDGVALRDVTGEAMPIDPVYDPVAQEIVASADVAESADQQPPVVL